MSRTVESITQHHQPTATFQVYRDIDASSSSDGKTRSTKTVLFDLLTVPENIHKDHKAYLAPFQKMRQNTVLIPGKYIDIR